MLTRLGSFFNRAAATPAPPVANPPRDLGWHYPSSQADNGDSVGTVFFVGRLGLQWMPADSDGGLTD